MQAPLESAVLWLGSQVIQHMQRRKGDLAKKKIKNQTLQNSTEESKGILLKHLGLFT